MTKDKKSEKTLFQKIADGEISSKKYPEFEDDDFFVINDINPKAKVHVLLITKQPFPTLDDLPNDILSKILPKTKSIAKALCKNNSYRIQINTGPPYQEISHFHLHIYGG